MILNLREPASILAWFKVWPERHGPQLAGMATRHAQFAGAIKEAGKLARSERGSAQPGAVPTQRSDRVSL